jgi:DNA-binding response OmpR family regulator
MTETPAVLLLVDDDEAKRYVIATWLKRAGHTVIEVGTGQEALDHAEGAEVILLDVNLPDMSGFDVCRLLKSDPRTAAIPVVQVSATAVAVSDRAYGLTQGADAYLIEPTEPAELLPTVMAVLRYYRARQRAELTASRLTSLTSVTLAISRAQTFDGLARVVAAGAARIFEAPAVLILVLPDGQLRRMSASPQHPVPVPRGGRLEIADDVAERVLGADEGHAATTIPEAEWLRLIPDSTLHTDVAVAVARTKPERPPVAIAVARDRPGAEEMHILRQLVQSAALAVEALRAYAEEQLIALTLQRSFLPSTLPEPEGLAICVRYAPASDQAEVGGDFYEALDWQGRLLLAIGDVQGHSLHAATVMGELRHALRAFASEGRSPLEITGLLNQVLRRYHPNIHATLCLALLDPSSGALEIVNCGHIPPLIVVDQATATYEGEGGLLLGMRVHKPHVHQAFVPPGGTALLITDGLIEDRHTSLEVNMERLRTAAQEVAGADIEAFGNHLMALFGPREDDVAMIALRRSLP